MKPLEKEENIRTEAWPFIRSGLPFAIVGKNPSKGGSKELKNQTFKVL
jgi:hypothetical protein